MAIATYAGVQFNANGGTSTTTEWSKDWFSPNLDGTGVTVIVVVAIASTSVISYPSTWTQIGSTISASSIDDTGGAITLPGGMSLGVYYQREPWGGNSNHKWTWTPATSYAVATVGFTGVSAIGTIVTDLGGITGSSSTLTAPQTFSPGQAGDLVFTVGTTRVGQSSSGSTYGTGAWTGGVGALPTVTYNTPVTGKPMSLKLAAASQTSGGQAVGGYTAPFTGHSGATQPKLWATKSFILRAETSASRRSFVYAN
jgi:hypothetical protein